MPVIPLAFLEAGREAVVVEIRGGRGLQGRLTAMGIAPGRKVRLVNIGAGGPAVVAVGDTRLAIGRGQLHSVMVSDE